MGKIEGIDDMQYTHKLKFMSVSRTYVLDQDETFLSRSCSQTDMPWRCVFECGLASVSGQIYQEKTVPDQRWKAKLFHLKEKILQQQKFFVYKKWSVANCGCFFSNPIFEVWDSSRQALHDSQFKETEQWTGLGRGSRSFDRGTEYKHSFSTLEGVSWGRLGIWMGRRGVLVVSGKRPGTDKLWTLCHLACQGMPWNKRWWLGGGRSGHLCLDLCPPIQTLGVCSLQTDLNSRWELQREPHNLGNHIRYTCSQHIMPEC